MLAPRMTMGHGVAEAVAMQVRGLRQAGIPAVVGCLESDDHYAGLGPVRVAPDAAAVADFAAANGATVIVAHGSPYFELLPELTGPFHTIAFEYGDPSPGLFPEPEASQRRAVIEHKRHEVYPHVARVAAISEFIRHEIDWPQADVLVLGIEHVPDLGPKTQRQVHGPLRVGALMRLGPGEARYKGPAELRELVDLVPGVTWEWAGRGTPADAADLRAAGISVHLNLDDEGRTEYLRGLDVFVTTSLWEGTNLPLVEAEALGTPGLALDVAAHPEFTPFVDGSIEDMAARLRHFRDHPELVVAAGRESYEFVRTRMSWERTVTGLLALCAGAPAQPPPQRSRWARERARLIRVGRAMRSAGLRETLRDQWRRRRRT